jgi:hypothetical protein
MENFVVTITCLLVGMIIRRVPDFPEQTGSGFNAMGDVGLILCRDIAHV